MDPIRQNDRFRPKIEPSEIARFKLFMQTSCKKMRDVPHETCFKLFERLDAVERAVREYIRPDKIDSASYGNQLPQVYRHMTARFVDDSYFPEPMRGRRQRNVMPDPPLLAPFTQHLCTLTESL